MSSALLLAPGDLIEKAKRELERRSITPLLREKDSKEAKSKLKEDGEKKNKSEKEENKIHDDRRVESQKSEGGGSADCQRGAGSAGADCATSAGGGDGGAGARTGIGGGGVGGVDSRSGGHGGQGAASDGKGVGKSKTGADRVANDDATRDVGSSEVSSGGITSGGLQGRGGLVAKSSECGGESLNRTGGCSGNSKTEGEEAKVGGGDRRIGGLATQEIADFVKKKIGVEVQVFSKGMSNLFTVDKSLLERGGLGREDILHQSDIVKEIRASDKKVKIIPLSTVKRMIAEFGGTEEDEIKAVQIQSSSIRYISNRMEDVSRAKAMFTAPTGDEGWKEVAKAATQRPNIMAYVHEGEGDGLKELLHLIDHI
ncbi:RNA helicase [African horse sickness virus 5]|uniref:RNA helicase n=1 Tax=African horse sickness virus 5 TaxID=86059 RepID=A0A189RL09_AHSV5|nr:RNA helicase [African horse sickness virus 5]